MLDYEVIIVGGGPVGVALGIELGLHQIKTLVLEKHPRPLRTPRAQSLSARTMEFFLRWGIDKKLEDSLLLPKDLPQTGIWCSNLCGESYFESLWGDNQLKVNASPKEGIRIPLWVTEKVLGERLQDFLSVTVLKEHEVIDLRMGDDKVFVTSRHVKENTLVTHHGSYVACCDGAAGPSKKLLNNTFIKLSEQTRMLGILFVSREIMSKKTVADGIMYFVLDDGAMAFVGPVDLEQGLWLAQVVWNDPEIEPDETVLSALIDKMAGTPVSKVIEDFYFWDMQVQLAEFANKKNRAFWLGDSAHAFAPTGGLGLNTGFGDAENLGWKLAAVIRNEAPAALLETYEMERRAVWQKNLDFSKQNSEQFVALKKQYSPDKDYNAYIRAYAALGNQFLCSSGLTLGYFYIGTLLTQKLPTLCYKHTPFEYTPKSLPGYFLPHVIYQGKSIYHFLSAIHWNLIVCRLEKISARDYEFLKEVLSVKHINILEINQSLYSCDFLLVRPDWHISRIADSMQEISSPLWERVSCA